MDLGKTKMVAVSVSDDGRLAVGWTLRPAHKNVKPVDWSLWSADDTDSGKFFDRYPWDPSTSDLPPYEIVELVADLKTGKSVEIDSGDKRALSVIWSKAEAGGRRYCLLSKSRHWGATVLTLVVAEKGELRVVDLLGGAEEAAQKFANKLKPKVIFTSMFFDPKGFDGNTARIGFSAENFDNHDDDVEGTLTVRLPDGAVQKTTGEEVKPDERHDPFKDNPVLAKADGKLNEIYGRLLKRLDATGREALKKEQRAWIARRDADAGHAAEIEKTEAAKEKVLIDATERRTTELQERMAKVK